MRSGFAFVASAVGLVLASPALAQTSNLYGGMGAGLGSSTYDVTIPQYPSRFGDDWQGAIGGVFSGVSWRFGGRWSIALEVDGAWSNTDARHLSGGGSEEGPPEVYQINQHWQASARLGVAHDLGERTRVYGALGPAWAGLQANYIPSAGGADSATVAGWSAALGVERDYGRRFFTRAEIRYATFDTGRFFHLGPSRVDLDSSSVLVAMGFRFGHASPQERPRALPVSAPQGEPSTSAVACATRDFVVYFEWDRSSLNGPALQAIDSAAEQARACSVSKMTVTGHADTSGSASYNMALSRRRASVVHDALAARGVAPDAIFTEARGEAELAHPTRDGVRDPLNRRTVVMISFR